MPTTEPTFGWPIAQGSDPRKQYPAAVDQPFKAQLASQLKGELGTIAPAAGWTQGSGSNVARAIRSGGLVVLRGLLLPTATVDLTTVQTIGTLPAGYYPFATTVFASIVYGTTAASFIVGRVSVTSGGVISLTANLAAAGTGHQVALGGIVYSIST